MTRLFRMSVICIGPLFDICILPCPGLRGFLHRDLISGFCSVPLGVNFTAPLLVILVALPRVHEVVYDGMANLTVAPKPLVVDELVTLPSEHDGHLPGSVCIAQLFEHGRSLLGTLRRIELTGEDDVHEPRIQAMLHSAAHQHRCSCRVVDGRPGRWSWQSRIPHSRSLGHTQMSLVAPSSPSNMNQQQRQYRQLPLLQPPPRHELHC
mmetsp:Transcript_72484/g.136915  ORF Transcript_72484/g.136915 Transcript_72484/m.136915 type:complete len:208 (+) Transcript_72484:173-796(+)